MIDHGLAIGDVLKGEARILSQVRHVLAQSKTSSSYAIVRVQPVEGCGPKIFRGLVPKTPSTQNLISGSSSSFPHRN